MTIAEIQRFINSKARVRDYENKQRASFDYILADLVGKSVARIYSSSNKMPTLAEAYPSIFSKEIEDEAIQKKKDELSAIRFRQFAETFNKNYKGVSKSE